MRTFESKTFRITKSRKSRNHRDQYSEKIFRKTSWNFTKYLKNIYKNFKKTFLNFKENFWKLWLTDCENVKCDEILMKICGNSTKKRKFWVDYH